MRLVTATSTFTRCLLAALDEKRKHNPYQNEPEIGPGPKGGWRKSGQPFKGGARVPKTVETGRFDCQCRRGTCVCKDRETGERVRVGRPLNQRAKARYNKAYKAWRREQKPKPQPEKEKEKP